MTKEQTPITADEFWKSDPRAFRVQPRMDMEMISLDSALQFAEQYARLREQSKLNEYKDSLSVESAEEISEKILYLPVTNGQRESSIYRGSVLIESYKEQALKKEREKWEEETKQEVLEALEMEIPKAINFYRESKYSEDEIKCYYETEAKAKYK